MRTKHLIGWLAVMFTVTWLMNLLPTSADADPPLRRASEVAPAEIDARDTWDRPVAPTRRISAYEPHVFDAPAGYRIQSPRIGGLPMPPEPPAILEAIDAQPLAGHPSSRLWRDPIWQTNFDIYNTWGVHPAAPVPAPQPYHGVLIDDLVRPAAAEEPIKTPACQAQELDFEVEIVDCPTDGAYCPLPKTSHAACAVAVRCPVCVQVASKHHEGCQCPACVSVKGCAASETCAKAGTCTAATCPHACPQIAGSPCAEECRQGHDLKPDEAAQVILEIMERLGGSRLEGTYFQRADALDPELARGVTGPAASPRQAIIQHIRALEASHKQQPKQVTIEAEVVCAPAPLSHDKIEVLRGVCENLDNVANMLERSNLYDRADQVRRLSTELRAQARGGCATPIFSPTPDHAPAPPREARRYKIVGQGLNSDAGIVGEVYEAPKLPSPPRPVPASRYEPRYDVEKPPVIAPPPTRRNVERELDELRSELKKAQERIEELTREE
jgi:hypothetical protein